MSPKPSLTSDGPVSSPASVNSSADPSSQLSQADGPTPCQEDGKGEAKKQQQQQEEEDEAGDSQDDVKGKMGKGHPEIKTEEKPEVRLRVGLILLMIKISFLMSLHPPVNLGL